MRDKQALAKTAIGPFGLLRQMTTELDRMFDDPWTLRWPAIEFEKAMTFAPKVDIVEKDNNLITRVDLPGVKKEDVSVEVANGQLVITGERKNEVEEKNNNTYRAECEYGSFYRAVPLPEGINADDVKATFVNGVLEVSMPMPAKPAANGKRIEIKEPAKAA